jgi:uncharacterized protein involved in exopolysaccharide biosynthesis
VQIQSGDTIDLLQLWRVLRRRRWLILGVAALVTGLSVLYALFATKWYRAEVLFVPADSRYSEGLLDPFGGLGGLAGLAGINVGRTDSAEPLAVLTSREFTRTFIVEHQLLPVLFAHEWDTKLQRWTTSQLDDQPDLHDGVKFFSDDIRSIRQDQKTGLITLVIEWTDPALAAKWANGLVERLNDRMRKRSLQEAEARVSFLKKELAATNIVTLQQSIARLLESELQQAMIARASEEFAFRIVDRAEVPKWQSRPNRALVIGFALLAGVLLPSLIVVARSSMLESPQNHASGARSHPA